MATIKYQTSDKGWVSLYADAIKNRLRKDKNLSDVLDKAEARKNLEIIGDNNTTHFHDSRYIPLIQKETQDRITADAEEKKLRQDAIYQEVKERDKAIQAEAAIRQTKDDQLQQAINQEINNRKTDIQNLTNLVNTKAYFDKNGRLVFPNGDLLWIGS